MGNGCVIRGNAVAALESVALWHGLAADPIEHESVASLRDLGHRIDSPAVHPNRDEIGRRGNVPIPQPMMNRLEVPLHFSCRCLEAD